jgi:arsenate reductase
MNPARVLFVCIHNSARSQMAEAWLKHLGGDAFEPDSAGLEPGTLNPLVVEAMREASIDISGKSTKSVFDVFKSGRLFQYVITVCDEASAERCPIFPGIARRLHWSFPDPSKVTGTPEEKLAQVRVIRDQVRDRVKAWLAEQR